QHQGRRRAPGERWRGGPCHVCQCLPSLAVRCSPYCPQRASGCPQGQVLVQGRADSCCSCAPAGESWGGERVPRWVGGPIPMVGGCPRHPAVAHGAVPAAGDNGTAVPPSVTPEPPSAAPSEPPGS
ncbi:SSPO protein, partial [Nyctibius grandis]|nr:SSPO protein [Nyctibius grandis]